MHPDHTTKVCSRCKQAKPLTTEHFYRGAGKGGWEAACKACLAAQRKVYKAAHKEKIAAKNKEWYEATRDTRRAYSRAYTQANLDAIRAKAKQYYAANKEKHKAAQDRWNAAHPESVRAKDHARRARKAQAEGTHSKADIKAQHARQKGKCYYCGQETGAAYHVDHIVPIARGGSNGVENLVIACRQCNQRKGDRLPHEWPEGGRLL